MPSLTDAARDGARWAASHPTAWSNANHVPSTTIEGQVQSVGGTHLPDDISHIAVTYLVPGSGTPTQPCGSYSPASNGFAADGTCTQATCVVPSNEIEVVVAYQYTFLTPLGKAFFPSGIALSANATMMEEQ